MSRRDAESGWRPRGTPGSGSLSSGRVAPHIMGSVEVSTTGTWRTRAARATTLWRTSSGFEISNARNEPGLVVDEQEYGALRRQALVGAAPGALGLVCRFAVAHAHNVLLLQKGVSWRAQPSAAEYLKCVLPQATRHQQGLPGHVLRIRRCQIHRRRRDVIGLPHASKWYLRLDRF